MNMESSSAARYVLMQRRASVHGMQDREQRRDVGGASEARTRFMSGVPWDISRNVHAAVEAIELATGTGAYSTSRIQHRLCAAAARLSRSRRRTTSPTNANQARCAL